MPLIAYIPKRFNAATRAVIEQANAICADYQAQGYDLTLRQLYYQFVRRALIPNVDTEYDRLGSIVNDARLAGELDWNYIVDRTRNVRSLSHWSNPEEIIGAVSSSYRRFKWINQRNWPEVWIEKDALVGVIAGVCEELDVPYFSCRGYVSQSEAWSAGRRFINRIRAGQRPIVLHLGDHDPSGIDMTRDIRERLSMFCGTQIAVRRLALNMDQVQQYNPPPNPAKLSDSRAMGYIAEYGNGSWELDALEPAVISDLIRAAVLELRDDVVWNEDLQLERTEKQLLTLVSDEWGNVREYLESNFELPSLDGDEQPED
ncbi:MAG: hypothetical protein C4542_09785 [Dehalococcoidia bacterium]|nr:MAG: hypothetical protein C4542_09785 [Dehalococcoidia bacterium]